MILILLSNPVDSAPVQKSTKSNSYPLILICYQEFREFDPVCIAQAARRSNLCSKTFRLMKHGLFTSGHFFKSHYPANHSFQYV